MSTGSRPRLPFACTLVLAVAALSLACCSAGIPRRKQVSVVFRFDDVSARSSTDLEGRLIRAFEDNRMSVTFAVVPYIIAGSQHDASPQDTVPLDSAKATLLRGAIRRGVLEVALHGYSHQARRSYPPYTEFSGLDSAIQSERIARARTFLESMVGTRVSTFVPPWDDYDMSTVRVVRELGFRVLSANVEGVADDSSALRFLPVTTSLHQLQRAVDFARQAPDSQPVVVVLFHPFDFTEVDPVRGWLTFDGLQAILRWVSSQHDLRVVSIARAVALISDLDAHRFLNNMAAYRWQHLMVPRRAYEAYLGSTKSIGLKSRVLLFYVFATLASSLAAFLIGSALFTRSSTVTRLAPWGAGTMLVGCLAYVCLRNASAGYVVATATSVAVGLWLGVLGSARRTKTARR
jgi:peptidoglycan/xylan/chitin deacetylase (PgdA/CDA1 family)